jgi:uncharacterized protein YecE (DUF72 family)
MSSPVYIGIAGWSYEDWKGIVYTDRKTDQLEFVSRFVDCVEINSTFYRPPFEKTTESWRKRTEAKSGFFFTAKLHKDFTHEGKIDAEMVRHFHKGFEPLLNAGKLKHLLVQFRYDFDDTDEHRRHIARIIDSFSDAFSIAVEVRHKSWENPDALEFLGQKGVTVCNLDYPTTGNSFNPRLCTVGADGYFRMHGRNFEKWFSKAGRDETYDYYYKPNELSQIKSTMDELAKAFESLTVIMNNHYRGAELANALELKAMLTNTKVAVPAGLLKTYPDLERIATDR